ncbi:hypothetical protein PTKU64_94220 (plasmid) [Paraburkholderia terrae]|uniref:DUF2894 domain-containing protein n=1 Tax=Paraburkholderia terrae TaxID=311230 RepID=A0ABM7U3G4_9BURK|nr:hypothetical protein [Paraburkholderia terrae]BCZ85747.1 hypothetical protein PTKU64_94220 [Paraburkholderia terrae]
MPDSTDDETAQGPPPPPQRGRGRPRKPDALTNAQRQAAWRARQRGAEKSVTVTENPLSAECERLRSELARARHELEEARSATAPSRGPGAPVEVAGVLERPGRVDPDAGERIIRLTLGNPAFYALERLVSHFGLSRRVVIERMLSWADDAVSRSFEQDDAAFNRYVDRRNRNR